MRLLRRILLATVLTVILLASTDVAAQTKTSAATSQVTQNWSDEFMTDRNGASNGRSLRIHTNPAEERESLLSKVGNNILVRWWLETEKTDDFVMKALKLKGLTGSALTTNENYKYFLKFEKKAESYRLHKWLMNDVPTYQAWKNLGMEEVRTVKQFDRIKNTKEFGVYKRYVNKFDNYVLGMMKAGYDLPKVMVMRGASKAEMIARVQIMAESKRSEEYAKVALGMIVTGKLDVTTLKGDALKKHVDYKYFELFLKEAPKWL